MLPKRVRGIDNPRADRDDGEAFVLELDRPLRGRDERGGLGHPVRGHVREPDGTRELGVCPTGVDDDHFLERGGGGAEEGEEGGDRVDHSEGVDLVLGRGARAVSDGDRNGLEDAP